MHKTFTPITLVALIATCLIAAPVAHAGTLAKAGKILGPVAPVISGCIDEEDRSQQEAALAAVGVAGAVGCATASAAAAGAGSLAGYAGAASAVSSLGLGSVTTAAAGALGSSATGAAATTMVVSAVGGPVVFAGLLVAGVGLTGYALYKGGVYLKESLQ